MTAPTKFAHIVYRTHRFDEMIDWYARVLEARIRYLEERFAFLSYDDEHHRVAFVNLGSPPPGIATPNTVVPGVHHVAYTWSGLDELLDTYKRLASFGIRPVSPVRHGMTLSLYYADPDGNGLEFQIDLLDERAATEFMHGPVFARNPAGEPFDPDALVARYELGKPVDDLIFDQWSDAIPKQHYCFRVTQDEFDAVLEVQSGLRIEHDLADLLCAPTPFGDPRGPSERLLARGHLDDREPADDRLCLWYRSSSDGPVGRHDARTLALDPATEDPDPGGLGFPDRSAR